MKHFSIITGPHFKSNFFKFDSFQPPPPIALSVVSMKVFAPHKMAEIIATKGCRIQEWSCIDTDRPEIVLRSRDKIKFVTKLTKVMKSPYYRGISLWDMLNEEQQRATTKVRFKG